MKKMVIAGHGKYASGMKTLLELICGENPAVEYVDFEGDDAKLEARFEEIASSAEEIIFACDMAGATPFMKSVLLQREREGIYSVGGANVSALVEAVNNLDAPAEEIAENLLATTKNSVRMMKKERKV